MIFPERSPRAPIRCGAFWVCALCLLLVALAAAAEKGDGGPDAQIQISADHLLVDNKAMSAVFSGNVTALQGTARITCERLTVFYETPETGADAQPGAIRRIVSEGGVVIHFDGKVAVTTKAIYTKDSGLLELIGEGTRVTSGQNTITGKRIVVDRTRDNITVEGDGSKRVEAVIFPGQADGGGLLPPAPPAGAAGRPAP